MTTASKRSVKNFLINPSFQMRISIYFAVAAFSALSVVVFIFYSKFASVRQTLLIAEVPIPLQMAVDGMIYDFIKVAIFAFVLMLLGIFAVGVIVTHRIAGPMYAILAYIEELKQGNYESKRTLRPYDELSPIMEKLKELAEKLKSK